MEKEEKKAFMLLKSLIFHYHGLDDDEQNMLNESAETLDAFDELKWANAFIAEDYLSAFDRSREYLNKVISKLEKEKRIKYLLSVWQDNDKKGYLTEMEATAMLNLAKDWHIEKEIINIVKQ